MLAAIEHGAQVAEKATVAAAVKVADAASKVKLIRTADAAPLQTPLQTLPLQPSLPTQPVASNAPTANQVIAARGYWQGPADGTAVANPSAAAKLQRSAQAASKPANANPDVTTGAIGPFVNPNANGPALALAYADPSGNPTAPAAPTTAPMGIAALRAAAQFRSDCPGSRDPGPSRARTQASSNGTTVAVKRSGNQASSVIMTASATSVTVVKSERAFPQSVDARHRAVAERASLPHHRGARRARFPRARGDDGQAAAAR